MNLGRRRTPPLPTLAISEQPLARGFRQFRPQARSGASETTFGPSKSSLFSRKKKISLNRINKFVCPAQQTPQFVVQLGGEEPVHLKLPPNGF